MKPLHEGELWVEPSEFLGRLRLDLRGRSTGREPARFLLPYLTDAFREAEESGTAIELHFEQLEQFNSSTIAVLVQFIAIARTRNIALTIFYDTHARWQAVSFDALQRALGPVGDAKPCSVRIVAAPTITTAHVSPR